MSFEDQWVEVNKVPTRILSWGKSPTQDLTGVQELFLCISGNPGVTLYYVTFLEELHNRTKVPVWMISHAGHELPPSRHEPQLSLPPLSDKSNEALYNLSGQTQHKLTFIQSHIPSHVTVHLIGHSVGSRMIVDLLREAPQPGPLVGCCYLLFPTLERIRDTPAANFIVPVMTYFSPVILCFASIFRVLPAGVKRFLANIMLRVKYFEAPDPYGVEATVALINPKILRQAFFLARDEMEKIKELDVETLEQHASKFRIYFGAKDYWCPVSFYSNLTQKCPSIRAYMCTENIKHAFILRSSKEMAEKLATWYEEDREGGVKSAS
ncbi:hypothetical protein M8J77_004367 [Diaphorina citri]|nr:hypothetical protein M8J77_004367 [Diaphorina citri]